MPDTLSPDTRSSSARTARVTAQPAAAEPPLSLKTWAWISAALIALATFMVSAFIVMKLAGGALERQLQTHDRGTALLLARLMADTETTRDALTALVEPLANSEDYAQIRIERSNGEILVQRESPYEQRVPHWFSSLRPLAAEPAAFELHSGAEVLTITVAASREAAHAALWDALRGLLLWCAAAALLIGGLGMLLLNRLLKPLTVFTAQATGLAELRFGRAPPPARPELRPLGEAMNTLAKRLEARQSEQLTRIHALDHLSAHDELTGLANRNRFLAVLDTTLEPSDANPAVRGSIAVLRVANLAALNRGFGRAAADKLLVDVAARLRGLAAAHAGRSTARLNGCDFALITPDIERPSALAFELSNALAPLENMHGEDLMKRLPIGVVGYAGGEPRERLLARLDSALAAAEHARHGAAHIGEPETTLPARTDLAGWRAAIEAALDHGHVRIDAFPVLDAAGALLHFEAPSRLLIDDRWYPAEGFLAWAERLGLTARLDLAALGLALQRIESDGRPVGINVSASSLRDAGFFDAFRAMLEAHRQAAASLWIELPEQGVVNDLPAFRLLCVLARPFGCRLGIEHAGREFGQLGGLHDIGLNYVKVDAGLIRSIASDKDKHGFLVRVCELARAIGLQVIAEGVDHPDDVAVLRQLEFDGMTGSVIRLREGAAHD